MLEIASFKKKHKDKKESIKFDEINVLYKKIPFF